jgi:uncharacterized repeat protein (TIGR01451 family)
LISGNGREGSYDYDIGGIGLNGGQGPAGVFNNYIGTDVTGTSAIFNSGGGVNGFGDGITFVGAVFDAGSGNPSGGNLLGSFVALGLLDYGQNTFLSGQTYFVGNLCGTDVSGNNPLQADPIGSDTLATFGGPDGYFAQIGGPTALEQNVFSGGGYGRPGYTGDGLHLTGNTLVINNIIGRNKTGDTPLPNTGDGIVVFNGPNKIGGSGDNEQNVIANNDRAGIRVGGGGFYYSSGGERTWISANRIFQNVALGIDLDPNGVNPNDLFDLDEGANRRQNYPLLSPPIFNPNGTVTLTGTLSSAPNTEYVIGFFATQQPDPTQYGEGGFYQGATQVTTDANGNGSFTFTTPDTFTPDVSFTSLAQDPEKNTSEFSCVAGKCFADLDVSLRDDVDPIEAGSTLTYTSVVNNGGPAAAPGVTLTNTLPTLSYNFISATTTQGTCTQSGNQVVCDLGSLDVGATATVTIKITPTQTGRITDKVVVTSVAPDPNPANNQASEDTEVVGTAIIVNRTGDEVDADPNDSVCDVDPNTAENQCTLRAAIQVANARAGRDLIKFDINGTGLHTITPQTALPTITQSALIDATTQPGYSSTPVIELSGAAAGQLVNGLYITGGTTTVKGMAINGWGGYGIFLENGAGNIIESCMIGTNPAGTSALGNALSGIYIKNRFL